MAAATMEASSKISYGPIPAKMQKGVLQADSKKASEAGKLFHREHHGTCHGSFHPNAHESSFHESSSVKKIFPSLRLNLLGRMFDRRFHASLRRNAYKGFRETQRESLHERSFHGRVRGSFLEPISTEI